MAQLLLVEDERLLRWAVATRLTKAGHSVDEAATLAEAEELLRKRRPELVLLDVSLPDGNGVDFLSDQRERLSESIVVVVTGSGNVQDAVRAMKLGAYDFLNKPVDQDELLRIVDRATAARRDRLEVEGSRRARERQVNVVAESPAMKRVLNMATTVAASSATTVLIEGETGVGKEVVARFIHLQSPRSTAPLMALNCAALPPHLVESELFGYEKGAFTDAKTSRKGLFELADGGTVVLDEVADVPAPLQAKLLRVLEERRLRRLGGSREISVDVRVLALGNRPLSKQVAAGEFREDLFYRLNVFPISVPPLRERREDIIPLASNFVIHFSAACGKHFPRIAPDLEQRLLAHSWRGNVRELRNLIERAVILEEGPELTGISIPLLEHEESPMHDDGIVPLDEVEFVMVQRAMTAAGGNQSAAARLLRVSRDQLRYRLKRYREEGREPGSV